MTMETKTNDELRIAWDFVEHTGRSIFLTGKAGTGKTTFLKNVVERSKKRSIVVAPTGVIFSKRNFKYINKSDDRIEPIFSR